MQGPAAVLCLHVAVRKYSMKFQIHPCDDGRFFVLDTHSDEVLFHTWNKTLVTRVVERMNHMDQTEDHSALDSLFDVAQIH